MRKVGCVSRALDCHERHTLSAALGAHANCPADLRAPHPLPTIICLNRVSNLDSPTISAVNLAGLCGPAITGTLLGVSDRRFLRTEPFDRARSSTIPYVTRRPRSKSREYCLGGAGLPLSYCALDNG